MKNCVKTALCALLLFIPLALNSQVTFNVGSNQLNTEKWITSNFGAGKLPPFTFNYGGKSSTSFITKWNHSIKKLGARDGAVNYEVTYTDPATKLEITCDVTGFTDYPAVEWVLHIANNGSEKSPQLTDVNVANANFKSKSNTFRIHYSHGSNASKGDFTPMQKILTDVRDSMRLVPVGGRSSDGFLPFMNIETTPSGSSVYSGVVAAIGWTGTWFAGMKVNAACSLNFTSGQNTFNAWLNPGEKIRTPRVCFLFWQGDNEFAGNNSFRHFMYNHHTRKIDGKPTKYPISAGFNWGAFPQPCNEYECLTDSWAIAVARQQEYYGIHPEVYWLDAGWFTGVKNSNWYIVTGNWQVDKERFPHGLMPISEEVHRLGCKFLVWFEPERTMPGTIWRKAHPEWMLHTDGKKFETAQSDTDKNPTLVNLGIPEASQWVSDKIINLMEENGIDYYRQDFNIEPAGFWWNADTPDRRGITEAKYIAGLYNFWDNLIAHFPNILIDNCASGGRRLDLETMSRSAPLWRTDYNYGEPNGYQCHTYGLSLYIPQSGTGCSYTDPYSFRSSYDGAVQISWKITDRNNTLTNYKWAMNEFYMMRKYFIEDYYPLCGVDNDVTQDNIWLAYQLNRPSDNTGYIVAFRRPDCPEANHVFKLYGLKPNAKYLVHNCDNQEHETKTGKQLMTEGIKLILANPRTSLLAYYEEVK